MSEKIDWKYGCIEEVALVLAKEGFRNITYQTTSNTVCFLSDGRLICAYSHFKRQ